MASKSPSPDDQIAASADDAGALERDDKLAAVAAAAPDDDDAELDPEDDEDEEDLVVFTAKEAAGALATIYAFIKPFLKNYRKMLVFVSVRGVIAPLLTAIMPLSLKFLIDDALGEEDFQALYVIL